MGTVGFAEIFLIILIFLLLFGAARLPALAKSLGVAVRKFQNTGRPEVETEEDPSDRSGS